MDPELVRLRTSLLLILGILALGDPGSIYAPLNIARRKDIPPEDLPDKVLEIAQAIMAGQQEHDPAYDLVAAAMNADAPGLAVMAEARANYLQRQIDTFQERLAAFLDRFKTMPGNAMLTVDEITAFNRFMVEQSEMPHLPMRVANLRFVAAFARLAYDPLKPVS